MSNETTTTANATGTDGLFNPPPKTPYEKAVAVYLMANASEALREKIASAQSAGKGIAQCYAYITQQARKEAKGSNSVMIADEVVYGWAVHYFEDEWQEELKRKAEKDERRKQAEEDRKKIVAKAEARHKARMEKASPEVREAYERAKAAQEEAQARRKAKEDAKLKREKAKRRLAEVQMTFNF